MTEYLWYDKKEDRILLTWLSPADVPSDINGYVFIGEL